MSELDKVSSGQPLTIPAAVWNNVLDMVQDYRNSRMNGGAGAMRPGRPGGNIILVRNDSGAARARFDVLGISAPVYTPTQNLSTFQNQIAAVGVTPVAGHAGKFVIMLEPLAAGSIGQALVVGVCPVQVNVTDANHGFADVAASQCGYLASGSTGAAAILWKESGTGVKWAIVKLAIQGGSSQAGSSTFPAKVTASLGSAAYSVREQSCTGAGAFADKSGAQLVTAHNLSELSLGPGGAMPINSIVLAMPISDTGTPPTTRYVFDHPVYAKYLD
jgi:hypothetical protein